VAMVQRREDGPPRFQIPIENAPTSRPFQTDPAGSLAISDALVASSSRGKKTLRTKTQIDPPRA
jgi:hypothetical protein